MNHNFEVQHMEKMNRKPPVIRKIDADTYVNTETGEIGYYEKTENRGQSYKSLRRTFKDLNYLINNNFIGAKNELFITTTYKENMTDTVRLMNDNEKFIKKIRYLFRDKATVEYISVIEPQERGAWHSHMMLKFIGLNSVFIPKADLEKMWGHGFVHVRKIDHVDNLGAYFTSYLTDLELTSENLHREITRKHEVVEKEVNGETKAFIKGGRLHMYPTGIRLIRNSRGIKKPERKIMTYAEAIKKIGKATPDYVQSYDIVNGNHEQTISYEQYNTKRL